MKEISDMKINIQYVAMLCVLLAALAWTGIWYIGNDILDQASSRATLASSAQAQSDRAAYTQRLAALVADTQQDRTALENISSLNIVSIVTMIEGVSTKTGIAVKVENAQPQGAATALPNGGSLSNFAFTVAAEGTFAQVMSTIQALENLPVPSSIQQLEITHGSGDTGKSGTWHLDARIQVFTTSVAS